MGAGVLNRDSWEVPRGGQGLDALSFMFLFFSQNPESGEYEFRYIFVELEPYSRAIVIEDNRS